MALIRIKHKNLADGVLIDQRDFDPAVHKPFEVKADKADKTDGKDAKADKADKK